MNHHTVLYRAQVVESDYGHKPDHDVWIVRCSCGWSVARQLSSAAVNQRTKHLKAATDA